MDPNQTNQTVVNPSQKAQASNKSDARVDPSQQNSLNQNQSHQQSQDNADPHHVFHDQDNPLMRPDHELPQPHQANYQTNGNIPDYDHPAGFLNQPQKQSQLPNNHPNMISINPEHSPIQIESNSENIPIMEVGKEVDIDPEVREYMERVEHDKLELHEPIVVHGEPVVHPAHWDPDKEVRLPVTKQSILDGLQQAVSESARWLAEWCLRMVKKFKGNVIYSDTPHEQEQN